jgi:hypothetical protein
MRILLFLIGGTLTVVVVGIVVGSILIVSGSPDACADRTIEVSTAAARELDANWDAFEAQAATGPATISISETQATSRAVEYLEEEDVPIEELQVYFCAEGYAEAAGKVDAGPIDAKIVIRGTLDLSGDEPEIDIQEIRAGSLPGFVSDVVIDIILSNDDARTLEELDVNLLTIDYTVNGETVLSGGPP